MEEEEAEKGEGIGGESSIEEEQDEELEDKEDEQGGCFWKKESVFMQCHIHLNKTLSMNVIAMS